MRRLAATALGLSILAASAGAAPVRANGVGPFDDVWVARSGEAQPGSGSSCARPHAVADGVDDQSELNWAVQHLNDHGTLHLCAGTFHLTNPIGRLSPCAPGCYFALPTHLTISGAGMRKTILDGGATYSEGVRTGPGSDIIWAFSDEEELTLSDLTVQNAVEPNGNGAAVSSSAAVEIIRVHFYRNETAHEEINLNGAAIDAPSITIIDSIFAENTADGDGGAISAGHVEVSGSLFRGNESGCEGGAISADSATVASSTFTGNLSGCEGGAIYASEDVNVTSSVFTSNVADDYGGAIDVYGDLVVRGSTFRSNESGDGGAIMVWGPTATVIGSTFTNNRASAAFGYGGAVVANSILVNMSAFTNNSAYEGGAIRAGTDATVTRSMFASNDASSIGGAVYAFTGTIARSGFTRNSAGEHGGALILISTNSDDLQQLRGNSFVRNVAPVGGAITLGPCNAPSRSEVARVERANRFSGNRATEQRRTNNIERWENGCG